MLSQKGNSSTTQPLTHSNNKPEVSVIMNCYNSDKYLREAIDSVYAQTFTDWEIIFFDNASTDKSADIAKSYDDNLSYFRNPVTTPLGMARNLAVSHARGKYIAFLDCDDIWLPQKLALQLEYYKNNPNCALVYSDSYRIDSNGKRFSLFSDDHPVANGVVPIESFIDDCVISPFCSVMVKSEYINEIKGFNPDCKVNEEYDFYIRLVGKGEIKYIDVPLVEYRFHPENTTWRRDEAIEEWLILTDRFLKQHPELKEKHPKRIAKRFFFLKCRLGFFYLLNGKYGNALKYFLGSLSSANFNPAIILKVLFSKLVFKKAKLIVKKLKRSIGSLIL